MKIRRLFKTQQILIECLACARAFQAALVVKNPPANAGDMGSIAGSGRSPGGGNGNLLQYSCLGNPRDSGAWQATVHRVAQRWTPLKRPSTFLDLGFVFGKGCFTFRFVVSEGLPKF